MFHGFSCSFKSIVVAVLLPLWWDLCVILSVLLSPAAAPASTPAAAAPCDAPCLANQPRHLLYIALCQPPLLSLCHLSPCKLAAIKLHQVCNRPSAHPPLLLSSPLNYMEYC